MAPPSGTRDTRRIISYFAESTTDEVHISISPYRTFYYVLLKKTAVAVAFFLGMPDRLR